MLQTRKEPEVVEENAFAVERLGPAREYGDASCLYCLDRLLLVTCQHQQKQVFVLLTDWSHLPRFRHSQLCRLHDLEMEQFDNPKKKAKSIPNNML
jgi:hypothetical protein